jgi:hypothetical protein
MPPLRRIFSISAADLQTIAMIQLLISLRLLQLPPDAPAR